MLTYRRVALEPGSRLGSHEIIGLLGAGGMGEVYRARDTKLHREVAVKVLPEAYANDPDRGARFQREAELLASLNHPNIAAIYGLEHTDGVVAIVLELVDGETLADLIARGACSIDDALPIARQIVEALEAAHEKGVVHRDLKPANVKITSDGRVKVLDFGLAKMLDTSPASSSLTMSPTLSVHATYAGTILGTAAYMSPEQARGKPVDRRTDVWAFGCVLYEMLTGRHAFDPGETVSDAIVSVLTRETDWSALPPETPSSIRRLLRRCLQKAPQNRLPHIGAARLEIDEALERLDEDGVVAQNASGTKPQVQGAWRRTAPWIAGGTAVAIGAAVLAVIVPWRQTPLRASIRLNAETGVDAVFASAVMPGAVAILASDGSELAFVAQRNAGPTNLYVRPLDRLTPMLLPDTEGASNPFFSPDGRSIGFFAHGFLKKISVTGGSAITVCETQNNTRGGTWADDGTITFGSTGGGLLRVSSAGGKPEPVATLADGEVTQRWPQMLPRGKGVLFTSHNSVGVGFDEANLVVQSLPAGPRKTVLRGGYYGRYVASGHLLYIHRGTLFAAPFSLERLEVTAPPVPVIEGVTSNANQASAQFAFSDTGILVYRSTRDTDTSARIAWMDAGGRTTALRNDPANWSNLLFSPDGRRFAMDVAEGAQTDVWVYEWTRDTMNRLTFGPGDAQKPVWTPDGSRIVFASTRAGQTLNLFWQRADGTGEVQRLTTGKNNQFAWSWHPGGRLLAFHELTPASQDNIFILPIDGDEATGWKPGTPREFLNGPFAERAPMFSPDGRWLAYQSTESGRDEIYVRPYPGPGGKWLISNGGGVTPTWSRIKPELFYGGLDQQIMVAAYTADGDSFHAEKPRVWTNTRFIARVRTGPTRSFDLHPDGTRFALAPSTDTAAVARQDKLTFVFNFFDELKRVAPSR